MSRFFLFVGQTTILSFSVIVCYVTLLAVTSGQSFERVLFRPTKSKLTNQSIWHWKKDSLEYKSVILGSIMALGQVDPITASTDDLNWNCFGVWGADPSALFQVFNHHIGEPENLIIPLCLNELSTEDTGNTLSVSQLELNVMIPIEPYSNLKFISDCTDGEGKLSLVFSKRGNVIPNFTNKPVQSDSTRFSKIKWNPSIEKAKSTIQFFRELNINVYFVFLPWHKSHAHEELSVWMNTMSADADIINLSKLDFADSLYTDAIHRKHPCDSIIGLHLRDSIVVAESLSHLN